MPYVSTTPRNPSGPAPPLRILASLPRPHLALDHSVQKTHLSVLPHQSSWSRAQHNTPVSRIAPVPQAFSSQVNKPLKSSLKCPGSWSNRETPTSVLPSVDGSVPTVARKRVRFEDSDGQLLSVCVFRADERPSSIFGFHSESDGGSETTLSDGDSDNDDRAGLWHKQRDRAFAAAAAALVPLEFADVISQIPSPCTPSTYIVRLQSITPILPARFSQQPLLLHGIVHVRNISYEKQVAARYTLDDWETTSEIHACYANPLPAGAARRGGPIKRRNSAWDQFSFIIPLMLRAPSDDPPRTLLLAIRFTVPGKGEWWDNNGGDNFRIVLSQLPSAGRGTAGDGRPPLGPPGLGSGPGLSLPSMWDVSFMKNASAEFPRKPLAVPCSANAQAAMAGALPSTMSWRAPIPTAVANQLLPVA